MNNNLKIYELENLLEPKLTKFKDMCQVVCSSIDSEDIKNLELKAFLDDIKAKSELEMSKIDEKVLDGEPKE